MKLLRKESILNNIDEPEKIDADFNIVVNQINNTIDVFTFKELPEQLIYNIKNIDQYSTINSKINHYAIFLSPVNAFIVRHMLKGYKIALTKNDAEILKKKADVVKRPYAKLTEDKKNVEIYIPLVQTYEDILKRVNAYKVKNGYRIPLTNLYDLQLVSDNFDTKLPKIFFNDETRQIYSSPIPGFDGTIDSLKNISLNSLYTVSANRQNFKQQKASTKTIAEKLEKMNINNLYDLLYNVPLRYIDKSETQEIVDMVEGETVVVSGVISNMYQMGARGISFVIKTDNGESIKTAFFNQMWLMKKFKKGDDVIVTGKFSLWNDKPQISGIIIENNDDFGVLPIIPIYKQSPTQGVTTHLIMSSIRELLQRIGVVKFPEFYKKNSVNNYDEIISKIHFPESLTEYYKAVNVLAYYEMVDMQIMLQKIQEAEESNEAVKIIDSPKGLQSKAVKTLPFSLTNSQKIAVKTMNEKFLKDVPKPTLLNSDVGTGKTLCAQLSILKAVDAGYQAVFVGPTEILAKQLYNNTVKLVENIEQQFGDKINVVFLSGSTKVREKRKILEQINKGEADIIVGTHTLLNPEAVKYNNLGFVSIDEQQKFGTDQRSGLIRSRDDGKVPHIMMQTATPIPRSTAQVFYGDIDMIELTDKPAGRLPIITEWVEEDPQKITEELTNVVWSDVITEANKGNQTFIITPLVEESEKIDAASVEQTYANLKNNALSTLNVGFVHGKMKKPEQDEMMEKFRSKEYDVLISSTVVEVGVDIPDATRVVILSADRLGSSSLHQIRGRVGRNSKPSKAYLISLGKTDNSRKRLESLVRNTNGFDIAKDDLKLRGEGTLFNNQQAGKSDMVFANLVKHSKKIKFARAEAKEILQSPYRDKAIKHVEQEFNITEQII